LKSIFAQGFLTSINSNSLPQRSQLYERFVRPRAQRIESRFVPAHTSRSLYRGYQVEGRSAISGVGHQAAVERVPNVAFGVFA